MTPAERRRQNNRSSYATKVRAARLEVERHLDSGKQRAAGLCDCGLPLPKDDLRAERCGVCQAEHQMKVKRAFEGL